MTRRAFPITFKLGEEEQVTFAFVDRERAEEYYAAIKNYRKTRQMPSGASKEEAVRDTKTGNGAGIALGLHLNALTNEYELVKVVYNASDKTASILSVEFAGKLAARAYDALKIAFIKNGVIK